MGSRIVFPELFPNSLAATPAALLKDGSRSSQMSIHRTSRADLDLQPMTPPTRCGISLFFRRSNQRSGEMGGDVTCVCQSCPWHATIHMKSNILWPDPATTHGPCHGPSLLIKQTPQGFPGLFIEHICDRSNSRKKERTKPARNS